jgi:hypothetical protein
MSDDIFDKQNRCIEKTVKGVENFISNNCEFCFLYSWIKEVDMAMLTEKEIKRVLVEKWNNELEEKDE